MTNFIIKDLNGNVISQGEVAANPTAQPGPNWVLLAPFSLDSGPFADDRPLPLNA